MDLTANSQSRNENTWSWRSSLAGVLLAAALLYFWIVPLFRPRGDFLWGHYRLKDIYIGIPMLWLAVCVLLVLLVPARYRRSLSLRRDDFSDRVALGTCSLRRSLRFRRHGSRASQITGWTRRIFRDAIPLPILSSASSENRWCLVARLRARRKQNRRVSHG